MKDSKSIFQDRNLRYLFICLLLGILNLVHGQIEVIRKAYIQLEERGEIFFSFPKIKYSVSFYSNLVSIDKVENDSIYAYANKKQFEKFIQLNIPLRLLTPPSLMKKPLLKSTSEGDWQNYPAYSEYIQIMENFASTFPAICKLIEIGESGGGKKILAVKLSDNADIEEDEPKVFYSAGIHGDEGAGVILMLRLTDYFLTNYGLNEKSTMLLNNVEVYINPLSNLDGFYFLSDTSNWGAKRYNLNNVNLNANYPDPIDGEHPDGYEWQIETIAMMNFLKDHRFILSANFHDGAEVVNYPWDTWARLHADNDWFYSISREYADTVHNYADDGYFTFLDNGVTNGFQWYEVSGGRQDYVTGILHGREVTIELSNEKSPIGIDLQFLWESNKESLINYLFQSLQGIKGLVKDTVTGNPIEAKITIPDRDDDFSFIISKEESGIFYRMLQPGYYTLQLSSDNYETKQKKVYVEEDEITEIDVYLEPAKVNEFRLLQNPTSAKVKIFIPDNITGNEQVFIDIIDISGKIVLSESRTLIASEIIEIDITNLNIGIYILKIRGLTIQKTFKIEKL